jgi:thymidylate synthase (FAD)
MKIMYPSFEILTDISKDGSDELKLIERAARTCYKSEGQITESTESAEKLIRNLIKNEHEAMLEHSVLSIKIICDRGVSHEIVRHRLFSFAQESTRYCNYSKDKFGKEIAVISPKFVDYKEYYIWKRACKKSEKSYFKLLSQGVSPQIARSVLPTCLKTEIVVTGNYREWRHFFKLRCDKAAHPQIRDIADEILIEVHDKIPVIFDDIYDEFIKA